MNCPLCRLASYTSKHECVNVLIGWLYNYGLPGCLAGFFAGLTIWLMAELRF